MAFSSVPSRLGPFIVRNVLCTTGAGALLRVEEPHAGRPQTIMLLDPDLAAWPRKLRDRRVLPSHPRLCAIATGAPSVAQQGEQTFYYVGAESLSGWTVMDEIARDGAIRPISRAIRLCAEAADALVCAHAAGLHHGHLEPGCLFIQTFAEEDEGHVKVLGAGLGVTATPASRAARYRLPSPRARTIAQRQGADLVALGGILYHMISGQAPDLGAALPPLQADGAPCPALDRLIGRAATGDPRARHRSASDLHEALLDVLSASQQGVGGVCGLAARYAARVVLA